MQRPFVIPCGWPPEIDHPGPLNRLVRSTSEQAIRTGSDRVRHSIPGSRAMKGGFDPGRASTRRPSREPTLRAGEREGSLEVSNSSLSSTRSERRLPHPTWYSRRSSRAHLTRGYRDLGNSGRSHEKRTPMDNPSSANGPRITCRTAYETRATHHHARRGSDRFMRMSCRGMVTQDLPP